MSDQSHAVSPTGPNTSRRRTTGWLLVATVALASALTGAAASRAVGQHAWHSPDFMGGPFDPARVEDGADRAVRHLAIEIDATTEQQE